MVILVEGRAVKVPVLVAVAVAELEAVCVGSDVKEAATLGVGLAEADAEGETLTEAEEETVADDVAVADVVAVAVSDGAAPTTIRGQQNWSVVEYKPEAKIHP